MGKKKGVILDIMVIILCLSGAGLGGYLFWNDLNRTLTKVRETPIGVLTYKKNAAQRRFAERLIWSQLNRESPLYNGDMIRTADLSDAVITFNGGEEINMAENCLVQIFVDSQGSTRLELSTGHVSVDSRGGNIVIASGEQEVKVSAGSVIDVGGGEVLNLRVIEGNASLSTASGSRQVEAGNSLSVNREGNVQTNPSVVVRSPLPNQGLLASAVSPVPVTFSWNLVDFSAADHIRLEIAQDRRFTRIVSALEEYDETTVQLPLTPGVWWWRVYPVRNNEPLPAHAAVGKLTIRYAPAPEPQLPIEGTSITYEESPPAVRFQWAGAPGADTEGISWYLEAADNPQMRSPQVSTVVEGSSLLYTGLGNGTWYWRVTPRYPSEYTGTPIASRLSSFAVEPFSALPPDHTVPVVPEIVEPDQEVLEEISPETGEIREAESEVPPEEPPAEEVVEPELEREPVKLVLNAPATGRSIRGLDAQRRPEALRWSSAEPVGSSRLIISRNADPSRGGVVLDISNPDFSVTLPKLGEGVYYWTVQARTPDGFDISPERPASFRVLPLEIDKVRLDSPAAGQDIPGLDALRRPAVLHWSSVEAVGSSRLIVSRNPDPVRGEAVLNIQNPDFSVTLPKLGEGVYYWTVQARTPDGFDISPARPASFKVLPLEIDKVRLDSPATGQDIPGLDALRRPAVFRWSSVEAVGSSRLIVSRNPDPAKEPVLDVPNPGGSVTLPKLGEGVYYWTVQARTPDGIDISPERPAGFRVLPLVIDKVSLDSPVDGQFFSGLDARRRPAVLRWSSVEAVGSSRLIVSRNPDPAKEPVLDVPNPGGPVTLPELGEGLYYWTVQARTPDGIDVSPARPASFRVLPLVIGKVSLDSPVDGQIFSGLDARRRPAVLRWSSVEALGSSRLVVSRNPDPAKEPVLDVPNPGGSVTLPELGEGLYYWTVQARTPDGIDVSPARPAGFRVLPLVIDKVRLDSPAAGQDIPGLDARRRPVVLRWSSVEALGRSRLLLTRNSEGSQREEVIRDVLNPGNEISLHGLGEGVYYWTIQAQTPDGIDVSPEKPAGFRVLPIPLLAKPRIISPSDGVRIGPGELRQNRGITFSWDEVGDADAYIFTLWKDGRSSSIIRTNPLPQSSYRLDDLSLLENGGYTWQIEALSVAADGTIERRGEIGIQRFVIDIPPPEKPVLGNPGTLYER